jgi:hypothetical protein
MKIYRIMTAGKPAYFATQDACYREVRRLSGKSCDPVEGEALEVVTWPLTKVALVDLLNGEEWVKSVKVFYTAAPCLKGQRPEAHAPESSEPTQDAPETAHSAEQPVQAEPEPEPEPTSEPGTSLGRLGPDTIELIDPQAPR